MTRTFTQWRYLADTTVLHRTTDDLPARMAFLDKIATACCELEKAGQTASIWHAVSLVTGRSPCPCGQCAKKAVSR